MTAFADARFEVRTASGFPVWFGGRRFADLRDACDRADRVAGGGQVVELDVPGIGEHVIYTSPKYRKRFPMAGGGQSVGSVERVQPPASLWSDGARPEWVTE